MSTSASASASAAAAAPSTAAAAAAAAPAIPTTPAYDLTQTLAKCLDKHMVLPLLDFLQEKKLYDTSDLLRAKIDLASRTKMVDFSAGEYKALHGKEPDNIEESKAKVYAELQEAQTAVGNLLAILNDENHLADQLAKDGLFTFDHLSSDHGVTRENIDALYTYARLNFECGRYRDAADYLYYYRLLSRNTPDDVEKSFQALWGKLASEILMVNGDAAYADLMALKEAIDSRIHVQPYLQLQQRAWLVTWSLFVFFNIPDGRVKMIEFMMGDLKLLNAIQASCPHLLRYLTTAVVINRKSLRSTSFSKNILKDLSRTLMTERSNYSDPIIEFLLAVYNEFNFERAHQQLSKCEELLQNDFFLGYSTEEFMEQARLLLFEAYTKIHKSIEIGTLAKVLDLASPHVFPSAEYKERKQLQESYANEVAAAQAQGLPVPPQPAALSQPLPTPQELGVSVESIVEGKLAELIRLCRVDAKIDAKNQQIRIQADPPSVYQQLLDKTKSIAYRATQLVHVVDKKMAARNQAIEGTD